MYFVVIFGIFANILLKVTTNGRHFASQPNKKCMPDFEIQWIKELGTSAFAATPLITDVNGDGELDIIAATFSGDIHVLNTKDGKPLMKSKWPFSLAESTIHASPLQFDFDVDGSLDVLIFTSQGEIYIISWDGSLIGKHKLDGLSVQRDWHEKILTAEENVIHDYILDEASSDSSYVQVDPHVLATPVLADLNADGRTEELIITLNYFYDLEYYSNPEALTILNNGLAYSELANYLASSLVILNATDMSMIRTIHMELTKVDAEFPGYNLFSPTVADIDGLNGPLEIICGSSAGHLHVFNVDGSERSGFPVPTDSIQGQITVEDVTQDGKLDLIMSDVSGNIACYDISGNVQWEAQVTGTRPSETRIVDLQSDGRLQVVMVTDDGYVWLFDGKTGNEIEGWPFKIQGKLTAAPLLTKIETIDKPVIAALSSRGYLHLLGSTNCRLAVTVRESSYVPVLSHDLIPTNPGLEFLVASKDGALLCMAQTNKSGMLPQRETDNLNFYALPADLKSVNNFMFAKYDIDVTWPSATTLVTSDTFPLELTILDYTLDTGQPYVVHISVGSVHLQTIKINQPLELYLLDISSPKYPVKGHLAVKAVNRHGKVAQVILPVSFHQTIGWDLQWLLISPTLAMGILLLFLYGFPPEDLLPSYRSNKTS